MSSRIRCLVQAGGGYYCGRRAKGMLHELTGLPVGTPKEMIEAARMASARLWLFREPRRVKTTRSRYKKLCAYLGIGKCFSKRKVKMNFPLQYVLDPEVPHAAQGGINGAANPRRRPAVAPGQMPQPHYYVHEGPDGALHVDQEPF